MSAARVFCRGAGVMRRNAAALLRGAVSLREKAASQCRPASAHGKNAAAHRFPALCGKAARRNAAAVRKAAISAAAFTAVFTAALASPRAASAQSAVSQTVLPKQIYVGDTAEIRCSFRADFDFFSGVPSDQNERTLTLAALPFDCENDDFSLEKAVLQKSGSAYTLVLTFVPWRTGAVDIPRFDLAAAVCGPNSPPYPIDPAPCRISSILENTGELSLRPPRGPLLVPGTMYAVYAAAAAAVGLLAVLVRIVMRRDELARALRGYAARRSCARNARAALRALKKLGHPSEKKDDADFCLALQRVLRNYLGGRFGRRFDTLTTSQLAAAFEEATGGLMSGGRLSQTEILTRVFLRTDYIRFARGSADSRRLPAEDFAAALRADERGALLAEARHAVWGLDGDSLRARKRRGKALRRAPAEGGRAASESDGRAGSENARAGGL